jgi:hypothetical protein
MLSAGTHTAAAAKPEPGPAAELGPGAEARPELDKTYVMRGHVEVFPLDSSSRRPQFAVRAGEDKSYVISEKLRDILLLFDGTRTLREVLEVFAAREGLRAGDGRLLATALTLINKYNLVEEATEPGREGQDAGRPEAAAKGKKKHSLEYTFHLPVIPPRLARHVTDRLTWLFNPAAVTAGLVLVVLTQLAFFGEWFAPRPKLLFGAGDILACYLLVLATALFHEFGHATACRRYGCEHGAIGFMLYLIFPALYVNLSNAWRLSGRRRAVIDAGGVYFQLLTTAPLYAVYLLTGSPHCAVTIISVDVMVLFSLNPILKFDGYWLLVDLSGLVNLRPRAWRVLREVLRWSMGRTAAVPVLEEINGRGKRLFLVAYSFLSLGIFTSFVLFLVILAPARAMMLAGGVRELLSGPGRGATPTLLTLGSILANFFFLFLVYKLFRVAASTLARSRSRGKTP